MKVERKRKLIAGVLGAAAFTAALMAQTLLKKTSYKVERIVDGDTFITTENQMIRFSGIDAPEMENCNGKEAKESLEKLILNKRLYLKIIYRDKLNRLISDVYNDKGLVSAKMVRLGMAYYTQAGMQSPELAEAANEARSKKLGVYSPKCTQLTNLDNPKCVIKANKGIDDRKNIYHFPGCGQYNNTLVQLSLGDRWFCTEAEAKQTGFIKGSDCFDKKY